MIYCNPSSLVILVNMQSAFISTQLFKFLQPFHIASTKSSLNQSNFAYFATNIGKSFVSNIIIDLSCSLNTVYTGIQCIQVYKWKKYKHVRKLFEVVRLHQHTGFTLYCLDRYGKFLESFAHHLNKSVF